MLDSNAIAFGIPGLLVGVACLMWLWPRLSSHRQVRRFRRDLDDIDVMAAAWTEAVREDRPLDDLHTPPPRHCRRPDDSGGGVPA